MSILGINTVHIKVEEVKPLGFNRLEVCLGRQGTYEERYQKALSEMKYAQQHNISYSIHLPLSLYDWFEGDYLDAFFLDKNSEKREQSFKLLQVNLDLLKDSNAEYFVMHFPGVYLETYLEEDTFTQLLETSLDRVNTMAKKANKKILLEYFGSNKMFSNYEKWTQFILPYSHLGILTDTGHLYYASLLHNFNFEDGFEHLSMHSDAFHLWTTKGNKAYSDNYYYKTYHHIAAHPNQKRSDGWAFDTQSVFHSLLKINKPVVIEATPLYEGTDYLYNSIKALQLMERNQ